MNGWVTGPVLPGSCISPDLATGIGIVVSGRTRNPLTRVRGRVARINGPQAGFIELAGGLEAFFVPARSGLSRGSENTPVLSFLGFSYDGLRAWGHLAR